MTNRRRQTGQKDKINTSGKYTDSVNHRQAQLDSNIKTCTKKETLKDRHSRYRVCISNIGRETDRKSFDPCSDTHVSILPYLPPHRSAAGQDTNL